MLTSVLDYSLPKELIAQRPLAERGRSRLMVVTESGVEHRQARDWPDLVGPEALVIVNDTKVRKARLLGHRKDTGGKVEFLLLRALTSTANESAVFMALARAARPLRPGAIVDAPPLQVEVLERVPEGHLKVRVLGETSVEAGLTACAELPLPPYVRRKSDAQDLERYQTVYAKELGSVAAPTAGLHLSDGMLDRLRQRGVQVKSLTLHIGVGTFRPIASARLEDHVMHRESFHIPGELCDAIADARLRGARVVAVGTTVVRALESAADPARRGLVKQMTAETDLMISPGYRFQVVDALLTNFHMPRSTLLALVAAFAGLQRMHRAYQIAVAEGYRMLSYGDAMWLPRRLG